MEEKEGFHGSEQQKRGMASTAISLLLSSLHPCASCSASRRIPKPGFDRRPLTLSAGPSVTSDPCSGSRPFWRTRAGPARSGGVLLLSCITTRKPAAVIYGPPTHGERSSARFVFVAAAPLSGVFLALGSGEGSGGERLCISRKTSAAATCSLMTLVLMQPLWRLGRGRCGEAPPRDRRRLALDGGGGAKALCSFPFLFYLSCLHLLDFAAKFLPRLRVETFAAAHSSPSGPSSASCRGN